MLRTLDSLAESMTWLDLKKTLSISSSWVVTRLIPNLTCWYSLLHRELTPGTMTSLHDWNSSSTAWKAEPGGHLWQGLTSPSQFPDVKVYSVSINPPLPAAREDTYLLCVTASSSKMLNSQLSSLSSNWAMEGGTSLMVTGIARWLWLWGTSEQRDGVRRVGNWGLLGAAERLSSWVLLEGKSWTSRGRKIFTSGFSYTSELQDPPIEK